MISYYYDSLKSRISKKELSLRVSGVWRYSDLLPIRNLDEVVSLGEGGTFLHRCERLAKELGMREMFVKDETTNPTGSFVDRGASVLVTWARECKCNSIVCATTGNLGASLSAYTAKAGMNCSIHIPKKVDLGKLYQMIAFGAQVEASKDYKTAMAKASESSRSDFLVTTSNPYLLEGLKTTGYEICEQLGWRTPDRILLPMGNGSHISMIWKAVNELHQIGLLEKPNVRMTGTQLTGTAPIVDAFLGGRDGIMSQSRTNFHAPDIGVEEPSLGYLAVRSMMESKGMAVTANYHEILDATRLLAKTEGIFAEPAAASTIAGLRKLVERGDVGRDEEIVCIITGTGLKDPETSRRLITRSMDVQPLLKTLDRRTMISGLGATKVALLEILETKESYGYEIWKLLGKEYEIKIEVPSVYQHLAELVGFALARKTKRRKVFGRPERTYYSLTEGGRTILSSIKGIPKDQLRDSRAHNKG